MFGYEARPPLTSFNKRMDHYIIGKLLEEEKVDIFDVQKAVEENYPDFEDQDFDVTKGQGPWTNAELLDEVCLSDDASDGFKYLLLDHLMVLVVGLKYETGDQNDHAKNGY